jgi:hypothetical protein
MADAPESIESAWNTFKGGTGKLSVLEAKELLELTETARITGHYSRRVCVYLKKDSENDEIPEIIKKAANEHDLVEVDRSYNYDETLDSITYTTEKFASE